MKHLRARLDALIKGTLPHPGDGAKDSEPTRPSGESAVLARILRRWSESGHPPNTVPTPDTLEPDDAGNIIDPRRMTLVATAEEWVVYTRALSKLEEAERRGAAEE